MVFFFFWRLQIDYHKIVKLQASSIITNYMSGNISKRKKKKQRGQGTKSKTWAFRTQAASPPLETLQQSGASCGYPKPVIHDIVGDYNCTQRHDYRSQTCVIFTMRIGLPNNGFRQTGLVKSHNKRAVGKGYLCGGGRDLLTQWILRKRFGRGEKDNPLLDFSERANNKAGRWARESIAAQ